MTDLTIYSPYVITELYTTLSILPKHMDNKIYLHLKERLKQKVENKCYKNFGYISEVYKILDYKDGMIEAENMLAAAIFDVSFSCKVCIPIVGRIIIAKVKQINRLLITTENGPILSVITNDRVNNQNFFVDNANNLRYKKDKKANTSEILQPNDFVTIIIDTVRFNNGDEAIKTIAFLNNIASDKEIEMYYKDIYVNHETKNTEINDKDLVATSVQVTAEVEKE